MSGGFRRTVAPTVARLRRYLQDLPKFDAPPDGTLEQTRTAYELFSEACQSKLEEIMSAIETVEKYNDKWVDLIASLRDDERRLEESLYDTMAAETSGLLQTLEKGREVVSFLKRGLKTAQDSIKKLSEEINDEKPSLQTEHQRLEQNIHVKLPKLGLPAFSGELGEWPSFWSLFERVIDATNLDPADKLAYLFSALKGPARELVQGFTTTRESYPLVVSLLKEKYADLSKMKRGLRQQLQELPAIRREADLIPTLNKIERLLQQISSIGGSVDEDFIEDIVVGKLPFWLVDRVYETKMAQKDWSIAQLRKILRDTVNRRENVYMYRDTHAAAKQRKEPRNGCSRDKHPQTEHSSNSTVYLATEGKMQSDSNASKGIPKSKPKKSCVFCGATHFHDECQKYSSLSQREDRLEELKRCERCLQKGHGSQNCDRRLKPCFYCKNRSHVGAMCPVHHGPTNVSATEVRRESGRELTTKPKEKNRPLVSMSAAHQTTTQALLMCKSAMVFNPDDEKLREEAVIFLDSGSHNSYIDEDLARRIKLKMERAKPMAILPFQAQEPIKLRTRVTRITIGTMKGKISISLHAIQKLAATFPPVEIDLPQTDNNRSIARTLRQPQILIGMDNFFELFSGFEKRKDGRYLVHTTLGPLIAGTVPTQCEEDAVVTYSAMNLQVFWDLESIGITDADSRTEDSLAMEMFRKSVTRDQDGRYSVGWPWRSVKLTLAPTFGLCVGRLNSLLKRLRGHPELLKEYKAVFEYQLEQGIIERAPEYAQGVVHYLPHQLVLTPGKTTKLRVVFDASAKGKNGASLNEALYQGPLLLPNLVGVLLRARQYRHLLIADIEKAFLQIGLHQKDRDATRFLWVRDTNRPVDSSNLEVYRYTRVLFGISSSPFLLAAVVRHHLEQYNTTLSRTIQQNMYVDNVVLGFNSIEEGEEMYQDSKILFQDALMNLRNYTSDAVQLRRRIPEINRYPQEEISLLGLKWNLGKDRLRLHIHSPPADPWTKRKISRFIGKHFDPLGLISPLLIYWKVLMQQLWKESLKWDQEVDPDVLKLNKNTQLIKDWKECDLDLERRATRMKNIEAIHVFTDASKTAFGVTVYGVWENGGERDASLLFAKSRLLPIKSILTIPKAELTAAWLGTKVLDFVTNQLGLHNTPHYAWTDSRCVVNWLKSKPTTKLPVFVRNRVNNIQETGLLFRYVSTEENSADLATRGLPIKSLINSSLWWQGPHWLTKPEGDWPSQSSDQRDITEAEEHLDSPLTSVAFVTKHLFDFSVTNSWPRMVNIARTILEAAWKWQKGGKQVDLSPARRRRKAEQTLILEAQRSITQMEKTKWHLEPDSYGILRIKDRLRGMRLEDQPIYLSKNHPIVAMLIEDAHNRCGHLGTAATLTEFRTQFWIEQGPTITRRILKTRCFKCRRERARGFALPEMSPLPTCRTTDVGVFQNVALDYAGPFLVKTELNNRKKQWVCLFSCLATRAVHLEIVQDLSTSEFINAFRRFKARRGTPQSLLSDNGTQFVGAAKILAIEWNFITPQAPWKGGVYERLIGLFKNTLKATIGRKLVTRDEFLDIVTQIEGMLNMRPITPVTSESTRALRPIDFLIPGKKGTTYGDTQESEKIGKDIEFTDTNGNLIKRLQRIEECLKRFWDIWKRDYLQFLRERCEYVHHQNKFLVFREPRIGELVILEAPNQPRANWKLARIEKIHRNSEGKVTDADLRLPNTRSDGNLISRSISKLYPLELQVHQHSKDFTPTAGEGLQGDRNLEVEEPEVSLCANCNSPVQTKTKQSSYYWWILLMLVNILLQPAGAIIAFDCTTPAVNLTTIDARTISPCSQPLRTPKMNSQLIQLVQLADDYQVRVKQCKVALTRTITYCGMNSYASVVAGGVVQYIVQMGQSMCKEVHQTHIYRYSGSITFSDLDIGMTHTRTATLSGSVDAEGHCRGGQYSDNFGSWSNVVVVGVFSITLTEYTTTAKTNVDEIRLRSQLVCKFSKGYCMDTENGDTTWEPEKEELCSERRHQVLYEGVATVLKEANDSTASEATYTVEQGEKIFALKTTERVFYCMFPMFKTEHPKLLIIPSETGKFYFKYRTPAPGSLDLMTYMNAKFVYLDKSIAKNMIALNEILSTQRCLTERRALLTMLSLAYLNPVEFAYSYTGTSGYTAVIAGEVIHLLTCLPVEVTVRNTARCYTELPVLWNNHSLFMTPRTRILQNRGTEISCSSILPPMYQLHQKWYAFLPRITAEPEPTILGPNDQHNFHYKSPAQLANGGIYNSKEIEAMKDHLMFPQERAAITNIIVRGMAGHDPDTQGINFGSLVNKDLIEKVKSDLWQLIWGRFTFFGNIASGLIGIIVLIKLVKWFLDVIINGRILYEIYGISMELIGALLNSVTTYLIHKGNRKEYRPPIKQELNEIVVHQSGDRSMEKAESPTFKPCSWVPLWKKG